MARDLYFLPRTQGAVYFLTLFFYAFVEPNDLLIDLKPPRIGLLRQFRYLFL